MAPGLDDRVLDRVRRVDLSLLLARRAVRGVQSEC